MHSKPVVVVGAGPVGLAATAELLERGLDPLVLERGTRAATAVDGWGHIRLFSPWSQLVAPAAERLLLPTGWRRPDGDAYPTGTQWATDYLAPLAAALSERIRYDSEVVGVARRGRDRVVDAGRDREPLSVHVRRGDGTIEVLTADALIDASGTSGTPNPLGGDGLPAPGEAAAADRIVYRVPDLADATTATRYAGKHVLVAGSGHSALTALVGLAELAEREPRTRITWLLRRGLADDTFGGGAADQLPARGALGLRAKQAVHAGHIEVTTGFRTQAVERDPDGSLAVIAVDGRRLAGVDEVIALTGLRPDLSWLSEIRLELDPVLQAPVKLAPLIDPNVHSCGTVYPHGAEELAHPEPRVFLAGMKSYGRAPTFLALTGYEQVRSIVASLAGDHAAAVRMELTLPETGVCGGTGLAEEAAAAVGGGCCAPAPVEELTLAAPARRD